MFSTISRYRKLPDVVTVDVQGRRLRSKSLRLTPAVAGRFAHRLAAGDRLDHLAHKCYRQSRHWWRICDANPEILSPWELVGAGPRATVRFEIARTGPDPPFSDVLVRLREAPGVDKALLGTSEWPLPDLEIESAALLFALAGDFTDELWQSVLRQELDRSLWDALKAQGLILSCSEPGEPPKLRIAVVVDNAVWRIRDRETRMLYRFEHHDDEPRLEVYESEQTWRWTLTLVFNRLTTSLETLTEIVASPETGFTVKVTTEIGRIGKPVAIPPRAS